LLVVCEGALAEKVITIPGLHLYVGLFDAGDLINITARDEIAFKVTVVLEKDGTRLALEGDDNLRVVE
jgi:hypothetical protein